VASMILTTECLITEKKEPEKSSTPSMPDMGGMWDRLSDRNPERAKQVEG